MNFRHIIEYFGIDESIEPYHVIYHYPGSTYEIVGPGRWYYYDISDVTRVIDERQEEWTHTETVEINGKYFYILTHN